MSKISTALRAAALGPAPRQSGRTVVGDWIADNEAFFAVQDYRCNDPFFYLSDDEKRLFLLFVAEAEEGEE